MKTLLLALVALTSASAAHAETFTCVFTEPFDSITYSTTTQTLVWKDEGENKILKTVKGVDLKIVGPEEFSFRDAKGHELLNLKLTFKGSDGMSENEFPYEGKTEFMGKNANDGIGGCSSSLLPVKPQND